VDAATVHAARKSALTVRAVILVLWVSLCDWDAASALKRLNKIWGIYGRLMGFGN